jgi:HEAT repeat protein
MKHRTSWIFFVIALAGLVCSCVSRQPALYERFDGLKRVTVSPAAAAHLIEKARPVADMACPANADIRSSFVCLVAHLSPDSRRYERLTQAGSSFSPRTAMIAETESHYFFIADMGPPPDAALMKGHFCYIVERSTGKVQRCEVMWTSEYIDAEGPSREMSAKANAPRATSKVTLADLQRLDVRERWGQGGLLQLAPMLTVALQDKSEAVIGKATELIVNTGDRVDPDRYENANNRAAMIKLERALLDKADDERPYVRQRIALTLGRCRPQLATRALLRLLRSGDADVRLAAGVAFGDLGDKQVVPELLEELGTDTGKDQPSSRGLIEALGRLKDPRAADLLIQFLGSSKPELRACGALYHIGSPKAVGPLKALLAKEKNSRVIELAKLALRTIEARPAGPSPKHPEG